MTLSRVLPLEPVGSVKPKINVQDKLQTREISRGIGFALLCPAQSYPIPAHRCALHAINWERFTIYGAFFEFQTLLFK